MSFHAIMRSLTFVKSSDRKIRSSDTRKRSKGLIRNNPEKLASVLMINRPKLLSRTSNITRHARAT